MILVGFTFVDVVVNLLYVSLFILVAAILYRYVLRKFSKGAIDKTMYCELYTLEMDPAKDEVPFYFTSSVQRMVKISILNDKMESIKVVKEFECNEGGNIVRYNTTELPDGTYFYELQSENQKIMKKMSVKNN